MSLSVVAGTAVTTTATFTNAAGSPTDPTTITLKFQGGTGSTTSWTYADDQLTRVSTGVYSATIDTTGDTYGTSGTWTVEWLGTGNLAAVSAVTFQVTTPPI